MKVSRNNQFYRFLAGNIITQNWDRPRNLCPFMHRVVWGVVINIAVGVSLGIILAGIFAVPALFFGYAPATFVEVLVTILGLVTWGLGLVVGITIGIAEYFDHCRSPWQVACDVVAAIDEATDRKESLRMIKAWYRAAHDKVCPTLEFYD